MPDRLSTEESVVAGRRAIVPACPPATGKFDALLSHFRFTVVELVDVVISFVPAHETESDLPADMVRVSVAEDVPSRTSPTETSTARTTMVARKDVSRFFCKTCMGSRLQSTGRNTAPDYLAATT
jgi:fibronectin type 3 domain-containing protein